MNIKEHIKNLLFTNQGVIIPELGGFVSEYEPAAFDVSENKFLPPSKKITFNPEYNYNDHLLSEFISKSEKIDLEKAKELISNFVIETKTKLKSGEKIDFPEIGSLTQTEKGNIQFEQNKESNLLSDSFGLHSIKTKPIAKPQKTENAKHPIKKEPQVESSPKKSNKKAIIISSTAVVVLSLIALSWFLTKGYKDFSFIAKNEKPVELINQKAIKNTEKNLDSIAKADSIKAVINQSIDENTEKKDALFYEEPEKEEAKPEYSAYHIIAGSFKKIENAEIFSAELKEKGYEPEIIHSGEDLIRIAIFTYDNESEALKKLYKLRESSGIKSVWILKSI